MSEATAGFSTPIEVITFIRDCVALNDPELLYRACSTAPSSFWSERLFRDLTDIERTDTLWSVFLKEGAITEFPQGVTKFGLGGCNPHTRHLHIDLDRGPQGWHIAEIWKCR
jgi:hypothetical protein